MNQFNNDIKISKEKIFENDYELLGKHNVLNSFNSSNTKEQNRKEINLRDWANTPLYKETIEGETELKSIINQVPDDQILKLANLSRDPLDPLCFTNEILVGMTLRKVIELTELEYTLGILRKRDLP